MPGANDLAPSFIDDRAAGGAWFDSKGNGAPADSGTIAATRSARTKTDSRALRLNRMTRVAPATRVKNLRWVIPRASVVNRPLEAFPIEVRPDSIRRQRRQVYRLGHPAGAQGGRRLAKLGVYTASAHPNGRDYECRSTGWSAT